MVKLNRTTEYGLMAISYIRHKPKNEVSSAREISEFYGVPFEILAKTLQKLKEKGIIASTYGTRGGYILSQDLNALDLGTFLRMMEGPVAVVSCCTENTTHHECEYLSRCNIKGIMSNLNDRISDFLNRISLEEITRSMPLAGVNSSNAAKNSAEAQTSTVTPLLYGEEP